MKKNRRSGVIALSLDNFLSLAVFRFVHYYLHFIRTLFLAASPVSSVVFANLLCCHSFYSYTTEGQHHVREHISIGGTIK